MRDDSSVRNLVEPTESLFPHTEASTSCLRPTPFLPTPSSTHPVQTQSSRRMVGTGELYPFPQDPSQAVDAVKALFAKSRAHARASTSDAVPPLAAIASDPPKRDIR